MITLAKFAAELGISRQAVYKAASAGIFPTYETDQGRAVNPEDTATAEYAATVRDRKAGRTTKPVKGRRPSGSKSPRKPAPRRGKSQKKPGKPEPVKLTGKSKPSDQIPDYLRDMVDSGNLTPNVALMMPKAWMDKLKIYEQMKTIRQAREEKRRSLVSRTLIKAVFGHIYEIHTTQFLTLKTKIIPDLLSIMSEKRTITADMVGKSVEVFIGNRPETITAADKIIDGESYKVLEAVKREINKALKMIHDKPID
jgi:hypothetical protein